MKGKLANIAASARRAVSRDHRLALEEEADPVAKRKRIPKYQTYIKTLLHKALVEESRHE